MNQLKPDGNPSKFDRSSWITLAIALLILGYILYPAFFAYTIPSDGWSLAITGDPPNLSLHFLTRLVDGPTPLQQNDELQAVDGRPASELLSSTMTLNPARPAGWVSGQSVRYSILRAGAALEVEVPLAPLPAQAFLRQALEAWYNSVWLAIFMYAFFLPAMVAIGVFTFLRRPRALAAQALLIISVCFVGQVSFAPSTTGNLFYGALSISFAYLLGRWTCIIIPTALLLSLAFPSPKGLLRHHLRLSLALIYLPWLVANGAIVIGNSGDLLGFYNTWILMGVVEMVVLIPVMAGALIHSFRTVHGVVERAQLKWFAFGLSGFVVLGGLSWAIGAVFKLEAFTKLVNYFGYLSLPVCLGVAILRYRLFDIDLIIRRTLVYTVMTAALGLVFFGGVTFLQWVFTGISGQQSPASVVISTLAIVVLFTPLRRRVQGFIDRRFYRQKYDAESALANFSTALRAQVDLAEMTGQLEAIVQQTVQPESLSLWMRKEKR